MLVEKFAPWERLTSSSNIFQSFTNPNEGPWFIIALAIYFTLMKILYFFPIWMQFACGAIISLPIATGFASINPGWDNLFTYFIMFQIGAYGRNLITYIADNSNLWWLISTGAVWAGLSGIMLLQGGVFLSPMRIPVSIAGVTMGVVGITLFNKCAPWVGLAWIGKKTLPIYLLHCPLIGVIYGISPAWPENSALIQFMVPLITTIAVVIISLLLEKPLRAIPGIFTAPWRGEGVQTLQSANK
nr:acyltransferase family protein [Corynebacterium crudilactis]